MKKRDLYWDNAKAILMLLVVAAHFMPHPKGTAAGVVYESIYLFHMPLFIFISGIFYKETAIKSRVISLCMIGITYNLLLIFIDNVIIGTEQDFYIFRATKIPWFVFSIAICSVVTYILKECRPWLILSVSILIGLFAGYDKNLMQYATIAKTICWFPFFYVGHLYGSKCKRFVKNFRSVHICVWGGVFLAAFLTVVLLTKNNETSIFTYKAFFHGQNVYRDISVKWLFMKVAYYVGVVIISLCVLSLVPVSENKFLNDIGQKTMQIYFWHIPLRSILFTTGLKSHLCTDLKGWLLWIVISVSVTWLLSLKPFGFPVNQITVGVRNTVHNES